MIDRGKDRQIYWMYISALSGGCSSENQIAVGANRVSECHMETNDHIAWGSFSIQQESAGWGQYNARLYSHTFRQIVATNSINVTKQLLPGLAPDSGYVMGGGPVECDSTLSSCSTAFGAGPFCGDIKIPTFAGYIDSTLPLRCGDGRAASPSEECDDGNTVNNDGCDSACKVEELSRCLYTFNPGFTFDSETRLYTVSPPDSTCIVPFAVMAYGTCFRSSVMMEMKVRQMAACPPVDLMQGSAASAIFPCARFQEVIALTRSPTRWYTCVDVQCFHARVSIAFFSTEDHFC
jgi:cysteine-rich repeat protein